jgi:hypothetical protein
MATNIILIQKCLHLSHWRASDIHMVLEIGDSWAIQKVAFGSH